ncbi:OLC1v1020316C1 [Oldenlandia corymbosa var. corymbosa]|nr:OLC1v1020316C1 [Oldenlandia corymbosa var. corymbosa]
MHIFDLQPMTDPLHLVCCNACRKPIKASQYALHAELCSSLTSIEEIILELDGGRGPKKPPRKERKKLLSVNSNQITSVEGAKFQILDASEVTASQSLLEKPSSEAKDCTVPPDGLGTVPQSQNPNCVGCAMPRSRKRSKMVKAAGPPPSMEHFETVNGVISQEAQLGMVKKAADPPSVMEHFEAVNGVISQEAQLGRVAPTRSALESQTTSSHLSKHQISGQVDGLCTTNKATISDVPVPLATKIYYSYGNHRLRTTLGHLYHDTSTMEHNGQIPNDSDSAKRNSDLSHSIEQLPSESHF